MRRPKVATLAARSSLPCCCTSAGSDVIRVFIRDVKQASRLERKGSKDGGWGELDQTLGKLGILGSRFQPGQDLAKKSGSKVESSFGLHSWHLGYD